MNNAQKTMENQKQQSHNAQKTIHKAQNTQHTAPTLNTKINAIILIIIAIFHNTHTQNADGSCIRYCLRVSTDNALR